MSLLVFEYTENKSPLAVMGSSLCWKAAQGVFSGLKARAAFSTGSLLSLRCIWEDLTALQRAKRGRGKSVGFGRDKEKKKQRQHFERERGNKVEEKGVGKRNHRDRLELFMRTKKCVVGKNIIVCSGVCVCTFKYG